MGTPDPQTTPDATPQPEPAAIPTLPDILDESNPTVKRLREEQMMKQLAEQEAARKKIAESETDVIPIKPKDFDKIRTAIEAKKSELNRDGRTAEFRKGTYIPTVMVPRVLTRIFLNKQWRRMQREREREIQYAADPIAMKVEEFASLDKQINQLKKDLRIETDRVSRGGGSSAERTRLLGELQFYQNYKNEIILQAGLPRIDLIAKAEKAAKEKPPRVIEVPEIVRQADRIAKEIPAEPLAAIMLKDVDISKRTSLADVLRNPGFEILQDKIETSGLNIQDLIDRKKIEFERAINATLKIPNEFGIEDVHSEYTVYLEREKMKIANQVKLEVENNIKQLGEQLVFERDLQVFYDSPKVPKEQLRAIFLTRDPLKILEFISPYLPTDGNQRVNGFIMTKINEIRLKGMQLSADKSKIIDDEFEAFLSPKNEVSHEDNLEPARPAWLPTDDQIKLELQAKYIARTPEELRKMENELRTFENLQAILDFKPSGRFDFHDSRLANVFAVLRGRGAPIIGERDPGLKFIPSLKNRLKTNKLAAVFLGVAHEISPRRYASNQENNLEWEKNSIGTAQKAYLDRVGTWLKQQERQRELEAAIELVEIIPGRIQVLKDNYLNVPAEKKELGRRRVKRELDDIKTILEEVGIDNPNDIKYAGIPLINDYKALKLKYHKGVFEDIEKSSQNKAAPFFGDDQAKWWEFWKEDLDTIDEYDGIFGTMEGQLVEMEKHLREIGVPFDNRDQLGDTTNLTPEQQDLANRYRWTKQRIGYMRGFASKNFAGKVVSELADEVIGIILAKMIWNAVNVLNPRTKGNARKVKESLAKIQEDWLPAALFGRPSRGGFGSELALDPEDARRVDQKLEDYEKAIKLVYEPNPGETDKEFIDRIHKLKLEAELERLPGESDTDFETRGDADRRYRKVTIEGATHYLLTPDGAIQEYADKLADEYNNARLKHAKANLGKPQNGKKKISYELLGSDRQVNKKLAEFKEKNEELGVALKTYLNKMKTTALSPYSYDDYVRDLELAANDLERAKRHLLWAQNVEQIEMIQQLEVILSDSGPDIALRNKVIQDLNEVEQIVIPVGIASDTQYIETEENLSNLLKISNGLRDPYTNKLTTAEKAVLNPKIVEIKAKIIGTAKVLFDRDFAVTMDRIESIEQLMADDILDEREAEVFEEGNKLIEGQIAKLKQRASIYTAGDPQILRLQDRRAAITKKVAEFRAKQAA